LLAAIEAGLAGGVDAVLLREKQLDSGKLLALAAELRAITRTHAARLLIHTQADIARAVEADGVHVASDAIRELPAMRRWLAGDTMSLSASCHSAEQLAKAHTAGADFALLSPVFPTASHSGAPHLGVERFRQLADTIPLPVVALGGIDTANRHELAAYPVAVIRAILDAADPSAAATALLRER
jgi:thiamine-phosphate diphosphorylase